MTYTIGVVVVTRNRLGLLQECIQAICNQTKSADEVIVVDNDSSDGTRVWLSDQGYLNTIYQENLGGAGGFNSGIRAAYERGHTWIWCMDDDGKPADDALEKLSDAIERRPDARIFNSFPINKEDHSTTAFAFDWWEKGKKYKQFDEVLAEATEKELDGLPAFFLGTFIHRDVVAAVGLPMTTLFIRGDEHEYIHRIYKAGYRIYTVVDSIFYHPDPPSQRMSLLGRSVGYEPMDDWKRYYSVRNAIYLTRVYGEYPERFRDKQLPHFWIRVGKFVLLSGMVQWKSHGILRNKLLALVKIGKAAVHGLTMRPKIEKV